MDTYKDTPILERLSEEEEFTILDNKSDYKKFKIFAPSIQSCLTTVIPSSQIVPNTDELLYNLSQLEVFAPLTEIFENYSFAEPQLVINKLLELPLEMHSSAALLMNEEFLNYIREEEKFAEIVQIYCKGKNPHGTILEIINEYVLYKAFPRNNNQIPFELVIDIMRFNITEKTFDNQLLIHISEEYDNWKLSEKEKFNEFLIHNSYSHETFLLFIDWELIFKNIKEEEAQCLIHSMINALYLSDKLFGCDNSWIDKMLESLYESYDDDLQVGNLLEELAQ